MLLEEKLSENAAAMGEILMGRLRELPQDVVSLVRGRGLLCAIVIDKSEGREGNKGSEFDAWKLCLALKEAGLLAKNTHGHIIRFAPPLVITHQQVNEAADIIIKTVNEFARR